MNWIDCYYMIIVPHNIHPDRFFIAAIWIGMVLFSFLSGTIFHLYALSNEIENVSKLQKDLVMTVQSQVEIGLFTKNIPICSDVTNSLLANPMILAVRIDAVDNFRVEQSRQDAADFSTGTEYPIFAPLNRKEKIGSIIVVIDRNYLRNNASHQSTPVIFLIILQNVIVTVILMLMFRQNVRERSKYESALIKEQNNMLAILEAIPDILFEVDIDGRYIDCYSRRTNLLAMPLDQLIGKTINDILPPETAAICLSSLQEANEGGFSFGKQYQLSAPDGCLHWFELSVARKISYNKEKPLFIALARDITDRKLQEAELIQIKNKLEISLQSEKLALERMHQLSFQVDQAIERERRRLAVEIHDELGSSLTAISINLSSFGAVVSGTELDIYRQLMSIIRNTLQTTRRISVSLRPPILDNPSCHL